MFQTKPKLIYVFSTTTKMFSIVIFISILSYSYLFLKEFPVPSPRQSKRMMPKKEETHVNKAVESELLLCYQYEDKMIKNGVQNNSYLHHLN